MYETTVTLQGWLGGNVTTRMAGDTLVANFRVASTPRRYQRKSEQWVDGATQWYSVSAWRALAENCQQSLRRGDPVVVHGRLTVNSWTNQQGVEVSSLEIEAIHVGHDLTRGTSAFTRTPRPASAASGESTEAGDPTESDEAGRTAA
jgi:single-strand DNA-binding protein